MTGAETKSSLFSAIQFVNKKLPQFANKQVGEPQILYKTIMRYTNGHQNLVSNNTFLFHVPVPGTPGFLYTGDFWTDLPLQTFRKVIRACVLDLGKAQASCFASQDCMALIVNKGTCAS